jgi:hypothetical protein
MLTNKSVLKGMLIAACFILMGTYVSPQEVYIDQKEGIIQNRKKDQISFREFEIFKPDLNKVVISQATKIEFCKGNFYILDRRQSRIYVFDKQANYLNSIGRPGQGPGDLEHPSDFVISGKDFIYVLNSMAKRIEVFFLEGGFDRRIELSLPKDIYYAHPSRILVDKRANIYIAYDISPHLIDVYNDKGQYQRTLVERKEKVTVPGVNIGNSSELLFLHNEDYILHLDYFTGIFTEIETTGKNKRVFSAFDPLVHNQTRKIKESLLVGGTATGSGLRVNDFQLWSNCCADDKSNIYVFLLLNKKDERQKMFVYSLKGKFLYWESVPYFGDKKVISLYFISGLFVFRTMDEDIFFCKKEVR